MFKRTTAYLALFLASLCFTAKAQTLIKNYNAIGSFAHLGKILFYAADDGVHGSELWKTDGTVAGTVMVKDIMPGPSSSNISQIAVFNGKIYFAADDGTYGLEVWQSDGTAAGTTMLKDIAPGNNASQPSQFTVMNNMLYFVAAADGTYSTLWKTDGTPGGTTAVTLGGDHTYVSQLTAVGNNLYFVKNPASLFKSDGTRAGTQQITVDDFYSIQLLQNINGKLVFITTSSLTQNDARLYQLDPVATLPVRLHEFQATGNGSNEIGNITAASGGFYFSIESVDNSTNTANDALWKSDGTAQGTIMVSNYNWTNYQQGGTGMQGFIFFNNKLFFAGTNDHTIWSSDGTAAGTLQTDPANMNGVPVLSGQKFWFSSNNQLWSFDGAKATAEVTQVVPTQIFDDAGTVYFTVTAVGSYQLWNNVKSGTLKVSLDFQPLTNGGTSNFSSKADSAVALPVTLQNIGSRELVFSGISVAGDAFYVNGQLSRSLPAGQQAVFNLIYYPARQGNDQAVLQIKSTDNSGQEEFIEQVSGTASGKITGSQPGQANLLKAIAFRDSIPSFSLSQDTVPGSAPAGTMVGAFQVKTGSGYSFSLTGGTGDSDNGSFTIQNGQLVSATNFNYNSKSTYSIRVQAVGTADTLRKNFTISIASTPPGPATGNCEPVFQSLNYQVNDVVYNGTRLAATSTAGTLLVSDDDAQHWKKITTGFGITLRRLRFSDAKTGYLLGDGSLMLKTEDNGDSWFPLISPDNSYPGLMGLSCPTSAVVYVFGSGGIFKSADGGRSWKKSRDNPIGITLQDIAFTDVNNGFICGTQATLIQTADGGKTWKTIPLSIVSPGATLTHLVFADSKTGFITTNSGDLIKTTDGGATWVVAGNPQLPVGRLYFTSALNGYALPEANALSFFKTADGGTTWTNETTGIAGPYTGLAINAGASKFCLAGNAIAVKIGSTWATRSVYPNSSYVGGNLFPSGTGYVLGGQNLKTTDGGITWKDLGINTAVGDPISNANFLSADTGYYTTLHSLFRTADGGANWSIIRTDNSSPIQKIYFFDTQKGFYTNEQSSFMTSDGGSNWTEILVNNLSVEINSLSFLTSQVGWATGNGNILYKTTDGGLDWTPTDMGANNFLSAVYFINSQTGFLGGANGLLMRTTDGGATWNNVVNSFPYYYVAFRFTDNQHGYVLGKNYGGGANEVFETFDAGQTWAMILQAPDDVEGFTLNDGQLFLTGANGIILHRSLDGALPANTGYILGDTTVAARNQVIYSVPATAGTNYQWAVTGNAKAEYHQNSLYVSWAHAGTYSVTVTPVNSCGTGNPRTISVQVVDVPEPVISGPDTVLAGAAHAPYAATGEAGETFSWTTIGGTLQSPAGNPAKVTWGAAGNGIVNVLATDTSLNIRKSGVFNVLIQPAPTIIADGELEVSATGSTCKGSNNGSILVKAAQPMAFTAVITGPGFNKTYSFTDSLRSGPLVPGVYNACIGLVSDTSLHRCYELNVTEPKDISLNSVIEASTGTVALDLSGADSYHVELNGRVYTTSASKLSLPLISGINQLKVYSDKLCQGVIEKVIDFHLVTIYPDPFTDYLVIDLGGSPVNSAHVKIAGASGRILFDRELPNASGMLNVGLPGLMPGTYVLSLTLSQTTSVFKIIKQ